MKSSKIIGIIFISVFSLLIACSSTKEEEQLNRDLTDSKQRLVTQNAVVRDLENARLSQMQKMAEKDLESKRMGESRTALSGTLTQLRADKDVAEDALKNAKAWKLLRSQTERQEEIEAVSKKLHDIESRIIETESELALVRNSMKEVSATKFVIQSSLAKIETDLDNARQLVPVLEKRIAELEKDTKH